MVDVNARPIRGTGKEIARRTVDCFEWLPGAGIRYPSPNWPNGQELRRAACDRVHLLVEADAEGDVVSSSPTIFTVLLRTVSQIRRAAMGSIRAARRAGM